MKKILFIGILVAFMPLFSVTQAHILDGAKEWNGHYYKVFEFIVSGENADKFCRSVGGHLATIDTNDELIFIQNLVKYSSKEKYWLGGKRDSIGLWKWMLGNRIIDFNWETEHPSSGGSSYIAINEKGKFINYDVVTLTTGLICEWDNKESAHDTSL